MAELYESVSTLSSSRVLLEIFQRVSYLHEDPSPPRPQANAPKQLSTNPKQLAIASRYSQIPWQIPQKPSRHPGAINVQSMQSGSPTECSCLSSRPSLSLKLVSSSSMMSEDPPQKLVSYRRVRLILDIVEYRRATTRECCRGRRKRLEVWLALGTSYRGRAYL